MYIKEIVYGGIDGIVTTFAIVAGFAGAQANPTATLPVITVLLFGFANLFADAVSMALGNFISSRSEHDVYKTQKHREAQEIQLHPDMEKEESLAILQGKGFSRDQARKLVDIYSTNTPYWTEFMMNHELQLPNIEGEHHVIMSIITFSSFVVFGFIPLSPYVFLGNQATFVGSITATGSALLLLGLLRWKVGQQKFVRSVGEILVLGTAAATTAYLVGTFFKV